MHELHNNRGINADGLPFPIKNPSKPEQLSIQGRYLAICSTWTQAAAHAQAHGKVDAGASRWVWANAKVCLAAGEYHEKLRRRAVAVV